MITRLLLLALSLHIVLPVAAHDIDRWSMSAKRITVTNGLPSNTVYDIMQDSNGFIWFGAAYGLCRHDGYSFANYYSLSSDAKKRTDATIGNLYKDDKNGLLWIHTSTFTFACYDIRSGRFVDYTCKNDEQRSYRRFVRQKDVMWMFDNMNGIRRIAYADGKFTCKDYTEANGLPTNHIGRMVEDGDGNMWAFSEEGLARIDKEGKVTILDKGKRQIDGTSYQGNIICLQESNLVTVFSPDGNRIKSIGIPQEYGIIKNLKSHFIWQGKWMLFERRTVAIDLETLDVSVNDKWQVANGWLLDTIDGYYFESNRSGKLWIFPPKGEVRMLELIPDMSYTTERNRRYNVAKSKDNLFYIATYGNGLFIYDYKNDRLRHFTANDEQAIIDNNYLTDLMVDRGGCLWVAQEAAGVSCITVAEQSQATFALPCPDRKGDMANLVKMIATEGDSCMILSTSENKMYRYHADGNSEMIGIGEHKASVYAYMTDSKGRTWKATRGDGLYIDSDHYHRGSKTHKTVSDNYHDIAEDSKGRVWLSTYEDGLLLAEDNGNGKTVFTQFLDRNNNERRLHQICIDSNGRLWIASHNGLYTVDTRKDRITDDDFICYNTDNSRFPYNEVRCIVCANDGSIWTGGKGSGVVRCKFDEAMSLTSCVRITTNEGLASNSIASVIEDDKGSIWAATESGLSMIYDKDLRVKTFQFGGNYERNIYSDGCAIKMPDGRLAFGTRYGINIIKPAATYRKAPVTPMATITGFWINGAASDDNEKLATAPNYARRIELGSNDNSISIHYSTLDYGNLQSALYQYYLEGADDKWQPMTSVSHADYSNLDPGEYVFHIRALSNNEWSEEKCITIVIAEPWYNTWWAWGVYIGITITLLLYVYHNAKEKLKLHEQMRIEKELTEFRMNFFTNITHEFRTPLAIIQGAVNKLQADPSSKAALQTAQRGTKRLLKMVNQLIEFRKINTGNMRLQIESADIIMFARDISHDFWNMAQQKGLQITFTPFEKHHIMLFDRQMIETIIYNLMSNAIKYTPDRGEIDIAISKQPNSIIISICDNGNGISKEQEATLFQPFMKGNVSKGGMGIGLYTSYKIAELHHGQLEYKRENGKTVFSLTLPANGSEYADTDYKSGMAADTAIEKEDNSFANEEIIREMVPESLNNISIAVIEDDHDMMEQICSELGLFFNVTRYYNGQSALEGIAASMETGEAAKQPAMIICDVMLPDMEGYDIVKQLKTDSDTHHIPVIMLTALDDEKHQLKSYEAGADDYMVKPCNFRLLVARGVQLIGNSMKAADCCRPSAASQEQSAAILTSSADKHFLEKISIIISQNISNSEFTVDQLAELMGMGRTKFFNKTKELTGMSPNKFLLAERMRKAAELLENGELTVAEVSYRVGIQDASYFNKCFKAKYGVVPSKYGKVGRL